MSEFRIIFFSLLIRADVYQFVGLWDFGLIDRDDAELSCKNALSCTDCG